MSSVCEYAYITLHVIGLYSDTTACSIQSIDLKMDCKSGISDVAPLINYARFLLKKLHGRMSMQKLFN